MLVKLNHLALELKLSHAEYHLMGVIIGYWNKKYGKSFPTVKILAKQARMSISTVNKCLNNLTSLGLLSIRKEGERGRHNYYLNQEKFFEPENNLELPHEKTHKVTPCGNANNNNKETNNYKKKTGLYLKKSSNNTPINITKKRFQIPESEELRCFNTLKNCNYWKHKPSNKIYKIKPEIGTHVLFKYISSNHSILIYEDNLLDSVLAFEPADEPETQASSIKEVNKINLINDLRAQNNEQEAQTLARLWKIPLNASYCAS